MRGVIMDRSIWETNSQPIRGPERETKGTEWKLSKKKKKKDYNGSSQPQN